MQRHNGSAKCRLFRAGIVVVGGLLFHIAMQNPNGTVHAQGTTEANPSEYQEWSHRYATRPISDKFGDATSPVKLVLTAVEGDEQKPDEPHAYDSKVISYGCLVSTGGRVSYFHHSALAEKGGGYPQLPEADLTRLDQLLAQLPDDGSRLPPAGRRLLVQVADTDHFRARVYDRADAPAEILEILRLTGSRIRSWLPLFPPVSQWTAHATDDGALCLSPDQRLIISTALHGPLKFWDPDSHEKVNEVATPHDVPATGLTLSPDGSVAALEGWGEISLLDTRTWQRFRKLAEPTINGKQHGLSFPQFTPDGRFLLLHSGQPALLVFDTKSWDRYATLPGLPKDALAYVPAPGTSRAIYLDKNGTIALWDIQEQRDIAQLDHNARIHRVAFSPDQSSVAVATVHQGRGDKGTVYRIRIWRTDTGELVHELKPFEQDTCEAVEGLLWSPDGRYVLAATKADAFFTSRGIEVWSTQSGRHRGEFSGCPAHVTGVVLLADGRLIAGCQDGIIRIWDTATALSEIIALEKSLSNKAVERPSKTPAHCQQAPGATPRR